MKKKILIFAFFANIIGVCSQTFTNSNQSLAGSWNGTLSKTVTVSGLPNLNASIFELVQVNLHLGDDANTRNYNTYRVTLTKGTTSIDLVATGGLPNSPVKQINTKFRFNPFLKRLSEHGGVAEPFSIGYYRSQDNYTAFNGLDPNGDWTVTITETSVATGGRFNRVDLVFKSPFTVQDYTTVTSYDNCTTPYCLGTAEIIVASNNGFTSQVEDMYNPNTVGCSWNAAQNNSAFFKFRAAQTSASVSISGISGNLQILAIDAGLDDNPCTAADNIVLNGGCPTLSSNDTYTSPQYINGSTKNNQLNLSGLTIGKTYYFIVDGTSSSVSPFYIETIGTSLDCSNCDLNATLSSNSPVCENSSLNLTCSDGTNWSWTGPNGFTSSSQNPTLSNVSTLASGIYTVVITDGNGCTETKSITVSVTTVVIPTFNASNPVCTGATLSPLPTISNNGISGTWSPALNTTTTTNYTFTPNVGQCATTATRTIVVNNCDFGGYATAVWMDDCTTPGDGKFYNTTGGGADLINQEAGNTFIKDFGVHVQNSSTLILRGSEVKTYKNGNTNVCGATMYYRFYLTNGTAGTFTSRNLSFFSDCNTAISEFSIGGGPCAGGQQKWQCVSQPGCDSPINLTTVPPGDYTLEVYYDVRGDFNSTSQCDDTVTINNGGTNYKANFSIISTPIISNTNPTTCNGTDGSITISGLAANEVYALTYDFNTTPVGSANFTSNTSGQITIPNLGIGTYTNFNFVINSCSTTLPSGVTLQNPIFTPVFSTPNPFCNGEAIPSSTLPTFSNNGISGNWTPALNNTATTTYTFSPDAGQCAINANLTVFINPEIIGGITASPNTACITLPATACNGSATITITQGSGNYSYLWNDSLAQTTATATNLCAGNYCVTVTDLDTNCTQQFCITVSDNIPNVTPTFSFGTAANICSGSSVPSLPSISDNLISGSWLPAVVDNANNGVYTFNPTVGQCATTATFSVSVTPQTTPTFSFGTAANICSGGIVPALPAISTNGVSGTWNPPIVDNTINAVYTFTPSSSGSSSPNLIVNGDFSQGNTNFNTDYQFLPSAGVNGVQRAYGIVSAANAWFQFFQPCVSNAPSGGNMMVVDGSTSNAGNDKVWGQTVAVLPNKTYTFSYWLQTIATPNQALIEVEINGTIIGSAVAPNTNCTTAQYSFQWNSGSNTTAQIAIFDRIFVANGNDFSLDDISLVENITQCASTAIFTVTVTPQTTPTFSFGNASTICSGNTVPTLPSSSENSISGFWLPPVVDNTNNGTYTFQPNAGQCATSTSYVVTITPQATPIFSFGTSSSICSGDLVTALPNTSSNSIIGSWSPNSVSNTNSGTYTFIPNTNQCATTTTFTVNVTPQTTPTFSFGTTTTICSGSSILELPLISTNSVEGLWSPSTVDSTNSGVYSFAPNTGQCATSTTLAVTVNPIPQFTITGGCDGDDYRLEIVEQNQNITNVSWLYNNAEIGQGNSIIITEEGVFTAVTTNSNGCQNSQEIDIVNSFCKIPKGVSANNDGDNDFFELSNLNVKKLQIFNRYGMVVYTKNNYTNEWNGQSDNGNEVPEGTYYYVVEQNSGKVRVGWVYLIREN
ncbi:gliding motility-associated C-terminal domain-containing protein [Flavobacterium sp. j3]|uniref:Gliding motility-associated C-terminal domain-containing protein n=1 Tax=Flavobacterium aureirubrum TaxID=3133147 RepID=A0ABU9N630_9FLAO